MAVSWIASSERLTWGEIETILKRSFLGDKTLFVTPAVWLKNCSHECWQCNPTVIWAAVGLSPSPSGALSLRFVFQIQGNEKEALIRCFTSSRNASVFLIKANFSYCIFKSSIWSWVEFKGLHKCLNFIKQQNYDNCISQIIFSFNISNKTRIIFLYKNL